MFFLLVVPVYPDLETAMKQPSSTVLICTLGISLGSLAPAAATAQNAHSYSRSYPVLEEPATGQIDYGSLRRVIEAMPNVIRVRIEECDDCPQRETLLEQLDLAERDRKALASMDAMVSGNASVPENVAVAADADGNLDVTRIPSRVLREPVPCAAFYNKALSCQEVYDDRDASDVASPCFAEQKLYRLCVQGKAKPFKAYMDLQKRKSEGQFASEIVETPTGISVRFYNVQPDMVFPAHEVYVTPELSSYDIYVDNTAPNTLRSAHVVMLPYVPVMYGYASAFMEPWKTIVKEDQYELRNSPIILCQYALADRADEWIHAFWYKERPEAADPARLSERMDNHPFLNIGSAVDHCPRNADHAAAINPRQAYDQQYASYRRVLDR